jgi:preprotein translocase subunit SecG
MSSEIIVVVVLVALAIMGLIYLERHSRRNKSNNGRESGSEDRS